VVQLVFLVFKIYVSTVLYHFKDNFEIFDLIYRNQKSL